jgi:endoglucanase
MRRIARVACCVVLMLSIEPASAGAASNTTLDLSAATNKTLDPNTRFFIPLPQREAVRHITDLLQLRRFADAQLLASMEAQPRAVWFTKGTPESTRRDVQRTMALARAGNRVPVLVAYNIPGRDCANLSAGGALTTAEYKAWIDGFAAGIGSAKAVVILEPDSLGLLPSNCGSNFPFTDAQRLVELNYAVDKLGALAQTLVYMDGTHSDWLSVGDISKRLVDHGVLRSQGFYLNASNFRFTEHLIKYGTWISKCFAFANNHEEGGWRLGHYDWCASQYFSPNGPVSPDDFSTWHFTDEWYDQNLGSAKPTLRFVIDTSRNGRGHWSPPNPPYPNKGVAQDWCNPPGRGLGVRATANTNVPLVDAFLWIKVPGESDGSCARGLGTPGQTVDPEWGVIDPAAGQWFRQQALQLAQLANPPLRR